MQKANKKNIRTWSMLGQRGTICGLALPEIMSDNSKCYVLTADLGHTSGLDRVMEQYPNRFINVGIAEQSLIGTAAGIAFDDNVAVATTFATFLTMRCFEQVRHNLGYQRANVKLLGAMSGFSIGMFGNTHYAYEDIALMRTIPNMTVISPADATEAYKAIYAAISLDGPVYIRLSDGVNSQIVYMDDYKFHIGKAVCLSRGDDATIVACGGMVAECIKAAQILEEKDIHIGVINMHTIKPLDEEMLKSISEEKFIFTVEEHSIIGGLGSAVSEYYAPFDYSPRHIRIGVDDKFVNPGEQQYIKRVNKLDSAGIAERIFEVVSRGR